MNDINGVAATATGAIATTKVANTIVGNTQQRFTLTIGATPVTDGVWIKPAAWRTAAEYANRKGVTFAGKDWLSQDQYFQYFQRFATQVVNIKMVTNNTDNFNGELIFTSKDPSGKETEITHDLSQYKLTNGSTFIDTINIDKLPFMLSPDMDIQLSEMKANSNIKFFFTISGQSKAFELSPITTQSI